MRVCIAGARERDTADDRKTVRDLIEAVSTQVPGCLFVTCLTHIGVGMFVKEKCLEKTEQNRHRFSLVECNVRVYAPHLAKTEVADIYLARNATPFEISDVLYCLTNHERRGPIEELLQRFIKAGRPYKVLLPGDEIEVI